MMGGVSTVDVTHFSDPGCPWAYSASPALAVLRWRYGDQLRWRLALVGLTESADQYERRGYTTEGSALGRTIFRRYGMPLAPAPKRRAAATSPACRVVVAARLRAPGRENAVFRALQFAQFTTAALLDDPDDLRAALESVPGVDAEALVAARDEDDVWAAYEADKADTRTAEGSPTAAQGKAAATDGPVRYTAPSLVFRRDGRGLEAGGFQPVEAYDVLVANLDPSLDRKPAPDDPRPLLTQFAEGLTTQEVAALMARGNDAPDRHAVEEALLGLVAAGDAVRHPLGDDALWQLRKP
jgi:2-hydroxychromene-2-carboxylate isomerase